MEPDQIDMMGEHELRKELRNLIRRQCNARASIDANAESNRQAAINSPQCADWSNGVAKGLELAKSFISENVEMDNGERNADDLNSTKM